MAQLILTSILCCGVFPSPTHPPVPQRVFSPPARPSPRPALTLLPCIPQTFFSRSSLWKVSRNRRTWSLRSWSMLRASMARPRNSSTSSSGFRASWAPRLIMGCRTSNRTGRVQAAAREGCVVPAPTSYEKWEVSTHSPSQAANAFSLPDPSHRPTYLSLLESSMPWRKKWNV